LRLLGELTNRMTTDRLERLGVGRGWRCLEVGAGDGSVARWLADRVAAEGQVVATDVDTRFLVGLAGAEVRRHDILRDPLESGRYDLVHCRALLMHLREPEHAVARMIAALRPGGWLVVEEGDMQPIAVTGPTGALRRASNGSIVSSRPRCGAGAASTCISAGGVGRFWRASGSSRSARNERRGTAAAETPERDSIR